MNHDYCHCLDYDPTVCPKTCFRAQLVEDYRKRSDMHDIPVTWAKLRNTPYCELIKPRRTNADKIRAMSDEELSKLIAHYIDCAECQESNIGEPRCRVGQTCEEYWLEWLRGDAEE